LCLKKDSGNPEVLEALDIFAEHSASVLVSSCLRIQLIFCASHLWGSGFLGTWPQVHSGSWVPMGAGNLKSFGSSQTD